MLPSIHLFLWLLAFRALEQITSRYLSRTHWPFPAGQQMRLNQNIMIFQLEETHEMGIVLILPIYRPR